MCDPDGPQRPRSHEVALFRQKETSMPKYLIAFNDEWVPAHTADELTAKSEASRAVMTDMEEAGVFLFAEGGIDASAAVFSVVNKDGQPVFTDGPFVETK